MNNLTTPRCARARPDHRSASRLDNLFCIFRPRVARRDVNARRCSAKRYTPDRARSPTPKSAGRARARVAAR